MKSILQQATAILIIIRKTILLYSLYCREAYHLILEEELELQARGNDVFRKKNLHLRGMQQRVRNLWH
jgi:hypothetical protein